MLKAFAECYRDSGRVALALPLLFALPFSAELIQHLAEVRIGMFASVEAARSVAEHPARMGFGHVKSVLLTLLIYWVIRWRAPGAARPVLGDARSARLFAAVVAYGIAISLLAKHGAVLLEPVTTDARTLAVVGSLFFLMTLVLDIYLAAWKAGAALGNKRLDIPVSLRVMHGNFWWSLAFLILTMLPVMVLHYGLNFIAIGQGATALWALLVLDSAVVACLGLILAIATFMVAARAADRADMPLAVQEQPGTA